MTPYEKYGSKVTQDAGTVSPKWRTARVTQSDGVRVIFNYLTVSDSVVKLGAVHLKH